uniref:Uncharacterized protein n=1 Tax=Amphimedon queenslandica TaxID=400682 RepID=A0A1X7VAC5_AMPQE
MYPPDRTSPRTYPLSSGMRGSTTDVAACKNVVLLYCPKTFRAQKSLADVGQTALYFKCISWTWSCMLCISVILSSMSSSCLE